MSRIMAVPMLFAGGIVLSLAAGCADRANTWYEQRCLGYGMTRGTPAFEACVARDRQWIEQERARGSRPGGNA